MVLQTEKRPTEIFTLGSKLAEVESRDPSQLRHPLMADYAAYLVKDYPNEPHLGPKVLRGTEAYPGLGRPMAKTMGAPTPFPVSGASQPPCGHRATDHTSDKFAGLSPEMATYNYNRTSAIMKGARPGC